MALHFRPSCAGNAASADALFRRVMVCAVWLFVAAALYLVPGCANPADTGTLEVAVIVPPSSASDPFQGVDFIRITISGVTIENPLVQTFAFANRSGAIRGVPFGSGRQVLLEGLVDSPDGLVVARGRTMPFEIHSGTIPKLNLFLNRVNSFAPTSSATNKTATMFFEDRVGAPIVELADGRILIAGGASLSSDGSIAKVTNTAVIFDPNTGDFSLLAAKLQFPRANHSATLLDDGTVLIAGGVTLIDNQIDRVRPCERFDPNLERFVSSATLTFGRAFHTATKLPDGSVVLAGGVQPSSSSTNYLSSVERYVPDNDAFQALTDLSVPRSHHTVTVDPNDGQTLYLIGGQNESGGLDSIQIYAAPMSGGSPSLGPTMKSPRVHHTATWLADLQLVAIIGGFPNEQQLDAPLADCEFFSVFERKLVDAPLATMNKPRGFHNAAAIDGKRILIYGGSIGSGLIGDAEILQAKSQSEIRLAVLQSSKPVAPRAMGQILRLANGQFLILGGVASRTSFQGERRGELFTADN
ncbi:MAG: hypothetical protein KC609_23205 [Myxococcales bacterium]|nr:hypothetical protein [Myxococcales bacterium]